ncbi:MAG: inositol phosphorylceramide synthase [Candidatus Zixiibacteriota bacterium]|nr:MAG: inositol phosphorylceramide synthase [candidate division Zixibacteria bacterium]
MVEKKAVNGGKNGNSKDLKSPWYTWIFRLRIEEFTALVFFFPMLYFTFKAYTFFKSIGDVPNVFVGDVQRVFGIIVAVIITLLIIKYRPNWTFLRDSLPFAFCIAIYTNLHDTIHFANPNDIHHHLISIDQWIFGAQPCVWAERFIHPLLTEIFSFCYMLFFAFAPAVALTLYLQRRKTEFRAVMVSVILCFYAGYLLYVLFPAVPPRITLQHLFTVKFNGTPLADTAIAMINVLPRESRAAFPSLHAAVTLISLMLAYKYVRWLFWVLLPFCTGLLLSTIYLRHHYVIDLVAGFILGILAFIYGPRIDAWWNSRRMKV